MLRKMHSYQQQTSFQRMYLLYSNTIHSHRPTSLTARCLDMPIAMGASLSRKKAVPCKPSLKGELWVDFFTSHRPYSLGTVELASSAPYSNISCSVP